jgi:hypothetical protein
MRFVKTEAPESNEDDKTTENERNIHTFEVVGWGDGSGMMETNESMTETSRDQYVPRNPYV